MDDGFARVLCRAIGILIAYWDVIHLPKAHPYRQAAAMVRSFLRRSIEKGPEDVQAR